MPQERPHPTSLRSATFPRGEGFCGFCRSTFPSGEGGTAVPDEVVHDDDITCFSFMLTGANGSAGFFRVDWYTPDGLRTWGDGRLTIIGTEGYIEVRKYVNLCSDKDGGGHVFWVNGSGEHYMNAVGVTGFPFFGKLILDSLNRTETAMTQAHAFKAAELSLIAQDKAERMK